MLALVTSSLNNEIVLSWRALQRLGVLPEDYPRSQFVKAQKAKHIKPEEQTLPADQPTGSVSVAKDKEEPIDDSINLQKAVKDLKEKYKSVFNYTDELKVMAGPAMKIELVENAPIRPMHVNTPRRTAYAYQKAAKEELDRLEHLGVIEKVQGGSEWISSMSFVPKPNGTMRLEY